MDAWWSVFDGATITQCLHMACGHCFLWGT